MRSGCFLGACLALLILLPGAAAPARAAAAEPSPAEAEFFEKEVRPLLVERCWKCHGESKPRADLRLTSRASLLEGGESGPAAVAGRPDQSLIIRAIRRRGDLKMPPREKLSGRQIQALTRWVEQGLPWPGDRAPRGTGRGARFPITEAQRKFWSFQPVRRVSPSLHDRARENGPRRQRTRRRELPLRPQRVDG